MVMKRMMRVVLMLALLAGLSSVASAADLKSFLAFSTGTFPADGVFRSATLRNTWGMPIYIQQTHIWMGMDKGGVADYAVTLIRESDGSVIDYTNWDHYTDPTGLHNMVRVFTPHYMLLAVGDSLRLEYGAKSYGGPTNGGVAVRIWWTTGPGLRGD